MLQLQDSNYSQIFRAYRVLQRVTVPCMFQTYPAQGRQLLRAQQMQSLWAEHKNQWKTIKACLPATPATSEVIINSFGRRVPWALHACRETHLKWELKRSGKGKFPCVADSSGVLGTMLTPWWATDTSRLSWKRQYPFQRTSCYIFKVAERTHHGVRVLQGGDYGKINKGGWKSVLWCPSKGQWLATTTPFLTSTCTADMCKQECTAGIFLAYTKKKVCSPQFKNSFSASLRYAALIINCSLNFLKSITVACEETSCT